MQWASAVFWGASKLGQAAKYQQLPVALWVRRKKTLHLPQGTGTVEILLPLLRLRFVEPRGFVLASFCFKRTWKF